ncbi:TolC family protein [Flavobacterium sp.]|uniref:TolC family protein n=1 Tax=Flavobacterium sp. TaxID=239 RepID=UPI002631B3AA|nr:TolC family protein [Flavobacterium sp.]
MVRRSYFNILILICLCTTVMQIKAQVRVTSLDEMLAYAGRQSIATKSDSLRLIQAKKAKLAAVINLLDISGSNTLRFVDNTKLPVSVFPAEIFGGQPGTFTNVTTGVRYTTTGTQSAEVKLLNLPGWENLKLSKINIKLQESDNKLNLKSLYEDIASAYFNVVTLQEQLKSNTVNKAIADSLYIVSENKYKQGLIRLQEVNDARVTQLSAIESSNQSGYLLEKYYLLLKILCDIPEATELIIEDAANAASAVLAPKATLNKLAVENSILNEKYALSNYRYYKKQFLPTLSAEFSQSWQLFNTNFSVFDGDWINSRYIGFKLSIPLPTGTQVANTINARYDYIIAQQKTEQAKIKATLENKQLQNDFEKAVSQYTNDVAILALRKESYTKNMNLYREGVLALDDALNSYNTMINADYALISSRISVLLARAKIDINNKIN